MLTEIKKPSLLPRLNENLETARSNYFDAKWPPQANGDLPGYRPSPTVASESHRQAEHIRTTRGKERKAVLRKVSGYLGTLVAAGTLVWAVTEAAHLMGNEEHAPWAHQTTPAHIQNK